MIPPGAFSTRPNGSIVFKVGEEIVPSRPYSKHAIVVPTRIVPIELRRIGYVATWDTPPVPWRWRNRLVSWCLRMLGRRPPDQLGRIFISATINDRIIYAAPAFATPDADSESIHVRTYALRPNDEFVLTVINHAAGPVRFSAWIGGVTL